MKLYELGKLWKLKNRREKMSVRVNSKNVDCRTLICGQK